jgi:hypothetical protein
LLETLRTLPDGVPSGLAALPSLATG